MPGLEQSYYPLRAIVFLAIPIAMLASRLPLRSGLVWRAPVGAALVFGVPALATWACLAAGLSSSGFTVRELIIFSAAMLAYVLATLTICVSSLSVALFVVTTGYSMQNLASGFLELLRLLGLELWGTSLSERAVVWLVSSVPVILITLACYVAFWRKVDADGLFELDNAPMVLMFLVVSLAVIGMDIVFKNIDNEIISLNYSIMLRISHMVVCLLVIVTEFEIFLLERLRIEKATSEGMLAEHQRQYDLIRNTIDAVNIKCHDLRHQIRLLVGGPLSDELLDEIAHDVNVYDSHIETGNKVMDTILTEKSLLCEARGIHFTCMVDGHALDFMSPSDLCAFFGNALDNAIEAVSEFEDESMRSISLVAKRRAAMVAIHLENYCAHEPVFEGGLPVTTKPDSSLHGFGARSMSLAVQRYGGSIAFSHDDDTFWIDVIIPVPAD